MKPCTVRILASPIPLAVRDRIVRIVTDENIHENTRYFVLERITRSSEKILAVFQVPDVHGSARGTLFVTYTMFDDGLVFDTKVHATSEDARQEWRDIVDQGNRLNTPYTRIL